MTAHRVLEDQLVADHTLVPPVTSGDKVSVDRSPALLEAGVSCVISEPQAAGLRLTIVGTANSVAVTIANSGRFFDGTTDNDPYATCTVSTGDLIDLISVTDGNNIRYKVVAGTAAFS
jgi:hypothetical protein